MDRPARRPASRSTDRRRPGIARLGLAAAAILMVSCTAGCSRRYEPGLGELMSLTQMRHAKVWLAGRAGNWPLAAYEIDELQEGFEDVAKFHPTHKDAPLPLSQLIPKIMDEPLRELRAAVEARDPNAFVTAYDGLTAGCNSCHQATNFGFNVVRRPADQAWYGNQVFEPAPQR